MTALMRVLKAVHDNGRCTLQGVVEMTGVPAGRVLAALTVLELGQKVSRERAGNCAVFAITDAGRAEVIGWQAPTTPRRTVRRG